MFDWSSFNSLISLYSLLLQQFNGVWVENWLHHMFMSMYATPNIYIMTVNGNMHSLAFLFCQLSGNSVKICAAFRCKPGSCASCRYSLPISNVLFVGFHAFFSLFIPFNYILWIILCWCFRGSNILVRQAQTHSCHIPCKESLNHKWLNHLTFSCTVFFFLIVYSFFSGLSLLFYYIHSTGLAAKFSPSWHWQVAAKAAKWTLSLCWMPTFCVCQEAEACWRY